MTKQTLNPTTIYPTLEYGFSQMSVVEPGKTVYISGQVGWTPDKEIVGAGDLRAQTWQTFKNIETALAEVGGTLGNIVILRIYIIASEMKNSEAVSDALLHFFPVDSPPTSTWIGVESLANDDFLIEIEPIAVIH